LSSTAG